MCLILRFDRVIFASVWRGALLELDHGSAVMRMLWEEESALLPGNRDERSKPRS